MRSQFEANLCLYIFVSILFVHKNNSRLWKNTQSTKDEANKLIKLFSTVRIRMFFVQNGLSKGIKVKEFYKKHLMFPLYHCE